MEAMHTHLEVCLYILTPMLTNKKPAGRRVYSNEVGAQQYAEVFAPGDHGKPPDVKLRITCEGCRTNDTCAMTAEAQGARPLNELLRIHGEPTANAWAQGGRVRARGECTQPRG